MRIGAIVALAAMVVACGGRNNFFRDFEYEEDLYVSLDGRATIYVNASVAALVALRGAPFDVRPNARVDRAAIRSYFQSGSSGGIRVAPVRSSRRHARPFVYVRVDLDDVRRASELTPLAWSSYKFSRDGDAFVFQQTVGQPTGTIHEPVKWTGDELASFRVHLPSRVIQANAVAGVQRGNILEWEQTLADRLRGVPVTIDVRMEEESILFRTLTLFAATLVAVAVAFAAAIFYLKRVSR